MAKKRSGAIETICLRRWEKELIKMDVEFRMNKKYLQNRRLQWCGSKRNNKAPDWDIMTGMSTKKRTVPSVDEFLTVPTNIVAYSVPLHMLLW
jgi:hypothetical protein